MDKDTPPIEEDGLASFEFAAIGIKEEDGLAACEIVGTKSLLFLTIFQAKININMWPPGINVDGPEHHHMVQKFDAGGYYLAPEQVDCAEFRHGVNNALEESKGLGNEYNGSGLDLP